MTRESRWSSATPNLHLADGNGILYKVLANNPATSSTAILSGQLRSGVQLRFISGQIRAFVGNEQGQLFRVDTSTMLLVASLAALADDWAQWGYNDGRQRRTTEIDITSPLAASWTMALGSAADGFAGSPVVADDRIFVASKNWTVYAIDLTASRDAGSAQVAWQRSLDAPISGSPSACRNKVYVSTTKGTVYCLNAADSTVLWQYPGAASNLSSPLMVGGEVILGVGPPRNSVVALDADLGTVSWERPMTDAVQSSPASDGTDLFVATEDGKIHSLDPAGAGALNWTVDTEGLFGISSLLHNAGRIHALPRGRHHVLLSLRASDGLDLQWTTPDIPAGEFVLPPWQALDTRNGEVIGADSVPVNPCGTYVNNSWFGGSSMALGDSGVDEVLLFVQGSSTLRLYAHRTSNLTEKWKTVLGAAGTGSMFGTPAVVGDLAFVGGMNTNKLYVIDLLDGSIEQELVLDGQLLSSPTTANGMVFAATLNGTLYAYNSNANRAPYAPSAATFSPSGGANTMDPTPTATWTHATDPNPGGDASTALRYQLRYDFDGEVLADWQAQLETAAAGSQLTITTPIAPDTHVTYRIRTKDSKGALSGWSDPGDFWVREQPQPPGSLETIVRDGAVELLWTASPSADIQQYYVYYKLTTEGWGSATQLTLGLAAYPAAGGCLQVRDDAVGGHGHLAWIRVRWSGYNTANGETWPCVGNRR